MAMQSRTHIGTSYFVKLNLA